MAVTQRRPIQDEIILVPPPFPGRATLGEPPAAVEEPVAQTAPTAEPDYQIIVPPTPPQEFMPPETGMDTSVDLPEAQTGAVPISQAEATRQELAALQQRPEGFTPAYDRLKAALGGVTVHPLTIDTEAGTVAPTPTQLGRVGEAVDVANEALTRGVLEPAAGLGTLGVRSILPPGQLPDIEGILTALQRAGADPNASPLEQLQQVGQYVYDKESLPVITGVLEQLPFFVSPTGVARGIGRGTRAVGRAVEEAAPGVGRTARELAYTNERGSLQLPGEGVVPQGEVPPAIGEVPTGERIISGLGRNFRLADINADAGRQFIEDQLAPAFREKFGDAPVMFARFENYPNTGEMFIEISEGGWQKRAEELGLERVGGTSRNKDFYRVPGAQPSGEAALGAMPEQAALPAGPTGAEITRLTDGQVTFGAPPPPPAVPPAVPPGVPPTGAPPTPPAVPPGPPPTGGAAPPPPPPSGGPSGKLNDLRNTFSQQYRGPTLMQRIAAIPGAVRDRYIWLQEQTMDRKAGVNSLENAWKRANPGKPIPVEYRTEYQAARLEGATGAGSQYITDMIEGVRKALGSTRGWDTAQADLDTYLHLKGAIDIEAAKGTQRLIPGGVNGASEAQTVLNDMERELGPERFARLQAAADAVVAAKRDQLYRMVDSGLVSKELADELVLKYPNYSPTRIAHYIEEQQAMGRPAGGPGRGTIPANDIRRLTEEGTESERISPVASTAHALMGGEARIFRNDTERAIGKVAEQLGLAKRVKGNVVVKAYDDAGQPIFRVDNTAVPNSFGYMENGETVVLQTDKPWLMHEIQVMLNSRESNSFARSARAANTAFRHAFVTYNPTWAPANLVTDYLAALLQGVGPREELRSLGASISNTLITDPVLAEMRRRGAGMSGLFANDPIAVMKAAEREGKTVVNSTSALGKLVQGLNPLSAVRGGGEIGENTTRRALFVSELKRGGVDVVGSGENLRFVPKPGADVENAFANAVMAARRGTIDFARGGEFTRAGSDYLLFLNPAVQGMALPLRALRDNPRTKWLLGGAMGAVAINTARSMTVPEYWDVPADLRYGSIIVMRPSTEVDPVTGRPKPNYVAIVPRTREWSAIFGPEVYAMEAVANGVHDGPMKLASILGQQATPLSQLSSGSITPGAELPFELAANYDTYRGRPIVPPELSGQPPTEQFNQYTSETIKRIAQSLGVSPMKLEFAFNGLTGGSGRTLTSITDAALRNFVPNRPDPRIAKLTEDLKALGPDRLAREHFLSQLPSETAKQVQALERSPQGEIPVAGPIIRRFVGNQGGALSTAGRQAAEEATGLSAEQTQKAGSEMAAYAAKLNDEQLAADTVFARNHDGKMWRETRATLGTKYQGAIEKTGLQYPQAAQLQADPAKWEEWRRTAATIGGQIPDRRERSQVLYAMYQAIPMTKDEDGQDDLDTFFKRQKEFEQGLPVEDRSLLKQERTARDTPTEAQYHQDSELVRPYFELQDKLLQQHRDYAQMVKNHDARPIEQQKIIEKTPQWKAYRKDLTTAKEDWRTRYTNLEKLLLRWGYVTTPIKDQKKATTAGVR